LGRDPHDGYEITSCDRWAALAASPRGITILLATWMGIPVSTTHTITGSMQASGSFPMCAPCGGGGRAIVWAWIFTFPPRRWWVRWLFIFT
jgi:PiT family inorganic phosphate transporter